MMYSYCETRATATNVSKNVSLESDEFEKRVIVIVSHFTAAKQRHFLLSDHRDRAKNEVALPSLGKGSSDSSGSRELLSGLGAQKMHQKETGRQDRTSLSDDDVALGRSLDEASASIEAARSLLQLRQTVGRNLRVAIRCLLEAQEKIEVEGPTAAARLDLLEAIRLIGIVEQELKGQVPTEAPDLAVGPPNRRAFRRVSVTYPVQLEPEHRTSQADVTRIPISGITLNVSKGGLLAQIDQGILRHGRYLVRFLKSGGGVQPEVTWGAVRRSRARSRGWEVGIEFDDPLQLLR